MFNYSPYGFKIGRRFSQKVPNSIDEYLDTAIKAHEFLESVKVETEDGVYWSIPGNDQGRGDLYTGSSGVVFFYLELYKVTKDEKYLRIIERGADYLNKHWRRTVDAAKAQMLLYGITTDTGIEYSYYCGVTGIAEILLAIYKELKRDIDLDTIKAITYYIIDGLKADENGAYWALDSSMLYDAGTMIYLYHVSEFIDDERIIEIANAVADATVNKAIKDERGGYAWISTAHAGVDRVPNFECGTAGIGYALTIAYKYTNNKRYLDAAANAAKHLKAIAVKQGDGFLVPWHDVPSEEQIFYMSTCHGPTGTSKIFYRLYEITGDEKYLDDVRGLYKGLRYKEVPEKMSAGYWNSVCVCCGAAGVLHFLINCAILFKDESLGEEAKQVAITAANILLGEQESKIGGRYGVWPIAYERVKPEKMAPEYAYSTGAAGIGASLLQAYLFLKGEFKWDRFVDDPYPTEG